MKAPDLYHYFRLDRGEDPSALGVILAGREAVLANRGQSETSPQRRQLMIAYCVLSDATRRRMYDDALKAGWTITWEQLEHLGYFNEWPQGYTGWVEPEVQARPDFAQKQAQDTGPSPYPNLLGPSAAAQNAYPVLGRPTGMANYESAAARPPADRRFFVAMFDLCVVSLLSGGALFSLFSSPGFLESLFSMITVLLVAAYIVVPEVKWGGSPGKLLFGYRVRDEVTKKNLTYPQAVQRNWFKLVFLIPAFGPAVGVIAAGLSLSSINLENSYRGAHDRLAGAEVVKKGIK